VSAATSRIAIAAAGFAIVAWLWLLLGLINAQFFVPESLPNPVIVFSAKGLDNLLTELTSLGLGCLGLLVALIELARKGRSRALVFAVLGNVSVCVTCMALLI
jgi:hypothetical protein